MMEIAFYILLAFNFGAIVGAILGAGAERAKFLAVMQLAQQQVRQAAELAEDLTDGKP